MIKINLLGLCTVLDKKKKKKKKKIAEMKDFIMIIDVVYDILGQFYDHLIFGKVSIRCNIFFFFVVMTFLMIILSFLISFEENIN